MKAQVFARFRAKTPERRFMRVLEEGFSCAPRVAQAILEEAQDSLFGLSAELRPGQVRVILAKNGVGHGRALRDTATTEVVWTVDAGAEDLEVLRRHGRVALRQVRMQRLLVEAVEQGAVATQEDLAQVLHVSVRTIKRDCACLQAQGTCLPTRGRLLGIGRGQTHKAQIVGRWLHGETYDQIALHTHHSITSIQRYIRVFARAVDLRRRGFSVSQTAVLLEMGVPLVREYLAVCKQYDSAECRERLEAQVKRLCRGPGTGSRAQKGGV